MRHLLIILLFGLVAFIGVTYAALEWDGVATVETVRLDGTTRQTHVWYINDGQALRIEAGTPDNPWFVEFQKQPRVTITVDGISRFYHGEVQPNPEGHVHIRAALSQKYGIRDWWVGILFDTSNSIEVLFTPV